MFRTVGIDIGTTFITVYEREAATLHRERHEGKILQHFQKVLDLLDDNDDIVITGKAGRDMAEGLDAVYIDETMALSYMLSRRAPFAGDRGRVIDIGASSLTLYTVNGSRIKDIAGNTLCAAGTGLFLEEQAQRLNINLENPGHPDIDDPPLIASRCTVFAKSDLIHHQQEGRSRDEMWVGLCRSLVVSAVNTLFRGEELKGDILVCGGVSLNKEVIKWFKNLYPAVNWLQPPHSEAYIAAGAALARGKRKNQLGQLTARAVRTYERMPPLTLNRSQYPDIPLPHLDKYNNEIRIHSLPRTDSTEGKNPAHLVLGMDIGSTSTKLAVLEGDSLTPLLDIYGRTAGDPVGAARNIFASLYELLDNHGLGELPITAFGTTGSGRKLVGKIFDADHIVNEISAHGRGTAHFFPEVETIFEIGGQDAKYIRLRDGYVADVNMNYVCAAGTGSFVEEQARKLGFAIEDVGAVTAGIAPPVTSDRCTVFMEQDLRDLLKAGFSKEEALAGVLYSIIRNYLNRVVGNRRVSEKTIFFQGATARNRGLVAALENLLGVEVKVSPFCHLMGAIGAALIAAEQKNNHRGRAAVSTFVGRQAVSLRVSSRTEVCKLCRNFCRINYISRENGTENGNGHGNHRSEFSWGYQCGRDPEEKSRKDIGEFHLFKERENYFFRRREKVPAASPTPGVKPVTIVNALTNHTYYPLWKHFFQLLGYPVRVSGRTDSAVKQYSSSAASADFCFPVKAALGHVVKALQAEGPIFLPYMIADKPAMETAHSFFCPYMESCASFVRSTLARNRIPSDRLLSPVIDWRRSFKEIAAVLYDTLKPSLGVKKKDVLAALKEAYRVWQAGSDRLERMGTEKLRGMVETHPGKPVFVLVGRPYNLHDRGLNLGIPEKLAGMGYTVIPLDMLELDTGQLAGGNYHNVYWKYGQKIIAAIQSVRELPNVFPIYFTNFNCGPDSFLLSLAEEEMQGRPMLTLELDEHDSDGGYLTRIEAFLDVVHSFMAKGAGEREQAAEVSPMPHHFTAQRRPDLRGTVWIPPMHPTGDRLYAATFRGFGFASEALPLETRDTLTLAKKYLRGGECLPMALTLGTLLDTVAKRDKQERHIIFMPTAEGPCRFGQYSVLERITFFHLGINNVDILSPCSSNSYQGLGEDLRRSLMQTTMCADVMYKLRCKVRPYERVKGDTDAVFEEGLRRLEHVMEQRGDLRRAVREITSRFAAIDCYNGKKPLVGVVGEIYVRCNPFSNGRLVDIIEQNGGEAWLTPIHEWLVYVGYLQGMFEKGRSFNMLKRGETMLTNFYFQKTEQAFYQVADQVLFDRHEPSVKDVVEAGARYLPREFEGEAILTVGRAIHFARGGAAMVVNAAPFGCMPGTLSSSILLEVKEGYEIPIVSLFYDGDIDVNDKVGSLIRTFTIENGGGLGEFEREALCLKEAELNR